jgi:glutaconate CoA-transferase subunit A
VQGYYGRDHDFFTEYHKQSRTVEGFAEWLDRWVLQVSDRQDYTRQLGVERIANLGVHEHAYSAPADFGY